MTWNRRSVIVGMGAAALPVGACGQVAVNGRALLTASEFPDLSTAVERWQGVGGTLVIDRDFIIAAPIMMICLPGLSYHLTTDRSRLIRYGGEQAHWALCIYSEGDTPFRIDGGLTIDGANRVAMPLFVRFEPVSGDRRRDFLVSGLACKNARIVLGNSPVDGRPANSYGASGMLFMGGFDRLCLSGVSVSDVSRAARSGVVGSKGSLGIGVIGDLHSTSSARHVLIEDFAVSRVDSDDPPFSVERFDMDGVLVFQAAEADGTRPIIRRGTIREAAGRAVKIFAPGGGGVTRDLKIFRSVSSRFSGSVDVNHQHGDGLIANIDITYSGRAHDLPSTPISMSSGTPRPIAFPFSVGEVRNVRIHDATGKPKATLIGLQYNVVDDQGTRRYRISHVIDDGFSLCLLLPGALGTYGIASIEIEDVNVNLTMSLFASEDPTKLLYIRARRANFNAEQRLLPIKVSYDGRPVEKKLEVLVDIDDSVSGLTHDFP